MTITEEQAEQASLHGHCAPGAVAGRVAQAPQPCAPVSHLVPFFSHAATPRGETAWQNVVTLLSVR